MVELKEAKSGMGMLGWGGDEREMRRHWLKGLNFHLCKMNEFWRSNVQHGDNSQQYYIVYLKFSLRIYLSLSLPTHTPLLT